MIETDNRIFTKKVSIIGLGLIGGSLAKALKHADENIYISAYDRPEVLNSAFAEKAIDEKLNDTLEALNSEIIFLSMPIDESLAAFRNLIPKLKKKQIISDLCSVKRVFSDIWKENLNEGIYIGAHPMTGKEKGGYENSDILLYENSVFIIDDAERDSHQEELNEYINLIKLTGARITFLNSELHDKIVASVSHLSQLLSVLLVNQVNNKNEDVSFIDFAGGGFRDMTRIASSDFSLWKPIIENNKSEILKALERLKQGIINYELYIQNDEYNKLSEEFSRARIAREEIPFNNKGFIDPLFDITVFVKDEPGMISKISTVLFVNSINIKDIELLKIREGSGGHFRLFFESANDVELATSLLTKLGFAVKQ